MTAITRKRNTLYRRNTANTNIYKRNVSRHIYGRGFWDKVRKFGQKVWDNKDDIIKFGKKIADSGIIKNASDGFKNIKDGKFKEAFEDIKTGFQKGSTLWNDNDAEKVRSILGIGKTRGLYGPAVNPDKVALKTYLSAPASKRQQLKQPNSKMGFDMEAIPKILPENTPQVHANTRMPAINARKIVKRMSKKYIKKITGSGIKQL